jgi:hypothetical protein
MVKSKRSSWSGQLRSLVTGTAIGSFVIGVTAYAQASGQKGGSGQSVSRAEADRILNMNYEAFAKLRESSTRPKGYRWDTDGCTPDWAPKYFTEACYLHAFGYRNYGSARKDAPHLSPTEQTKNWIDKRFYQEMDNICHDEATTSKGRASCLQEKGLELYNHVQRGRKAFFGPYGS